MARGSLALLSFLLMMILISKLTSWRPLNIEGHIIDQIFLFFIEVIVVLIFVHLKSRFLPRLLMGANYTSSISI